MAQMGGRVGWQMWQARRMYARREDYPENWQVATVHSTATSLPLLSALKFVGRWALEEHNPGLHHRFGNRETCL